MIKTSIQAGLRQSTSQQPTPRISQVARDILQQNHGWRALLTRGLTARLCSNVPASVLMIVGYEAAKRLSRVDPVNQPSAAVQSSLYQ